MFGRGLRVGCSLGAWALMAIGGGLMGRLLRHGVRYPLRGCYPLRHWSAIVVLPRCPQRLALVARLRRR